MNKKSTIFERILHLIEVKGLKNVSELAKKLGYNSPQKLYRLKDGDDFKPSYDMIRDFSNLFEDLNLRWFLTGEGDAFLRSEQVSEPETIYLGNTEIQNLKAKIAELEIEKKSLLLALREIGAGRDKSNE